jgi:radical SAM superfamily enzyme YgiQ (UPF0313 family)
MKIALVHPPEPIKSIASAVTQHPINLASLAAWLLRDGHDVRIWDYGVDPYDDEAFLARVAGYAPDLVGFSCMTPLIKNGGRMAARLKERFPGVHTVVGGPHVSAIPEPTLHEFPGFDLGVIGEGEATIAEVAAQLAAKGDVAGVAGTVHRCAPGGAIVVEAPRALIGDLDTLPYPARHLIDFKKYEAYSSSPGVHGKDLRITQMFTSRGCPVKCIFCASHVTHRNKVRFRSAAHVLGEVRECVEKYGIQHFTIDDDTFTYGKKRLLEVCEGLREIGIAWDCDSRVDSVSPEILRTMAASGCKKIAFGVESGSPRVLELIQKRITVERVEDAFRWANEAGLITSAFIMIGSHPDESPEDVEQTYRLIKRIRPDYVLVYVAVPYPGTALHAIMRERGLIATEDWNEYDIVRTVPKWRTTHFGPDALVANQKRMYRRIYFHPWFIWRKLASIHSLSDLAYFVEATKAFVRYIFLEKRKARAALSAARESAAPAAVPAVERERP